MSLPAKIMLMQPQTPAPNYNFIMQDAQKPKRSFKLPMPNLPKPFGAILLGVLGIFVLIIVYALFTGGGKSSGLGDIAARAQEISRVSKLVVDQSKDPATTSLATTVGASMNSDIGQIQNYLTKNGGKKLGVKSLAIHKKSSTDNDVQGAAQNGTIAAYYKTYLQDNLTSYQASLKTAYNSGSAKVKPILSSAYDSAQIILSSL